MANANEEALREAACVGDIEEINKLLELGLDVNSTNTVNGWTALHWASKRGHASVVKKLLEHGADKDIRNKKDEIAADLTSSNIIREELGAPLLENNKQTSSDSSFTPNYLANPEFIHSKATHRDTSNVKLSSDAQTVSNHDHNGFIFKPSKITCTPGNEWSPAGLVMHPDVIVLCVRLASTARGKSEFVEFEMDRHEAPTLQDLIEMCYKSLNLEINEEQVQKLRKLPHTILKSDQDVRRLTDYQRLELVLQPHVLHTVEGVISSPDMGEHAEMMYMKNQVAKLVF